jgi:hypothetical protein
MWMHGLGWLLPRDVVVSSCLVYRDGTLLCGGFLQPHPHPPFCLSPHRHFLHHPLCGPWPLHRPPTPAELVACERPADGLQLLPGHTLHLHLRMPWPKHLRLAPAQWPTDHWSLFVRYWQADPLPNSRWPWLPSPHWQPVPPIQNTPIAVRYHTPGQHAEWTFALTVK